jgi:hypothetical protein
MEIKIIFPRFEVIARLNKSETSKNIYKELPIHGHANTWGQEIYFEIPVRAALGNGARAEVEIGELGFWPEGNAFCIFFGPTPASRDEQPRAYSAINVIGRLLSLPLDELLEVKPGSEVKIEQAERS